MSLLQNLKKFLPHRENPRLNKAQMTHIGDVFAELIVLGFNVDIGRDIQCTAEGSRIVSVNTEATTPGGRLITITIKTKNL